MSRSAFVKNRAADGSEYVARRVAGAVAKRMLRIGELSAAGVARKASHSALVQAAVSSVREIPDLVTGRLPARDFFENRALNASESWATVGLTEAMLASTSGTAAAASVGGVAASGATALAGAVGSMGTVGAAAGTALGGVTATAAGPAILGGAVAIGTGWAVSRALKPLRRRVRDRQNARKANRVSAGLDPPRQSAKRPAEWTEPNATAAGATPSANS